MKFLKPARLKDGDTVAVLSPSWGGPSKYPHVFDMGLRNLEALFGLRIKEYPTARMDADVTYKNPKLRAEDLNRAFEDPEVSAIIASIGGDDSVRILPFLDLDVILGNPKILMGFSDTAVINGYLCSKGLVTFNGPSVMAGFAQMRHLPEEFTAHVRETLFSPTETYCYQPYAKWANEYVDWGTSEYDGVRSLTENTDGWRWLQGAGHAAGHLFGGCIEVFEFTKGTRFWPEEGFFEGKILFFETSEEKPTVSNIKYMLRNYGSMGVLDQISGLLFGRARSFTGLEKAELEDTIVRVVSGEFGRSDLPIVANMDFGHTDPQLIMPLGVLAEIDCHAKTIALVEPAVV
jgi:muramoyltetrapeptide carboxypeptidase LdcA involved in peptidoglycan recycling